MSRAFDTVSHGTIEPSRDLDTILEPDKLHTTSVLIKDVNLKVRVGKQNSDISSRDMERTKRLFQYSAAHFLGKFWQLMTTKLAKIFSAARIIPLMSN